MSLEATAHALAGLAYELIQPLSVVDVGCGPGVFLSGFSAQGVEDVQGVDGEPASRVFLLGQNASRLPISHTPLTWAGVSIWRFASRWESTCPSQPDPLLWHLS